MGVPVLSTRQLPGAACEGCGVIGAGMTPWPRADYLKARCSWVMVSATRLLSPTTT